MQAYRSPAHHGWLWISGGFALFRRNPAALTFLVFSCSFLILATSALPGIGPVLAGLFVPVLSQGIMNGCRLIDNRLPVPMDTVFSGFRQNAAQLLLLGLIHVVAALAVDALETALNPATAEEVAQPAANGSDAPPPEVVVAQKFAQGVRAVTLLHVPIQMAFWFAPLLVAWHQLSAPKAMFFSFFGCLRNWRAMLIFLTAAVGLALMLPLAAVLTLSAVSLTLARTVGALLVIPFAFVLIPSLFASYYIAYRDVYHERKA
ncbi:MAG: hypothetical protein KF778_18595 [Rhodocyclaceae bacterium]|nr:hypothetical protein [Rhodocyclaceae bacterium]MBX3670416.1 hypothetical protein [Rhodocyclaceae bacterium]